MNTLLRKVENAWSSKEKKAISGNKPERQWQSSNRIILNSIYQINDINTFHIHVAMAFFVLS